MAIERFIDELGTDLNKYTLTYVSNGNSVDVRLVRKATITQVGTPLNANKLNQLVDAINTNSAKQVKLNNVINNTPDFYAPTSGGASGQYLKSNGTSTPTWSDFPTSLPASDVYDWAKKSTKPTYTASEVGAYTKEEVDSKVSSGNNYVTLYSNAIISNRTIALSEYIGKYRELKIYIETKRNGTVTSSTPSIGTDIKENSTSVFRITDDSESIITITNVGVGYLLERVGETSTYRTKNAHFSSGSHNISFVIDGSNTNFVVILNIYGR